MHPKNYPICVLLTLPVKDFRTDQTATLEAEELILANLKRFNIAESDHVLIACNTAHLLKDSLERRSEIKFDSLIESAQIETIRRNIKTIGLLASSTSIDEDVHALRGIRIIRPQARNKLEEIIGEVVNGAKSEQQLAFLRKEARDMFQSGAEAILLGCTEIEMLLQEDSEPRFIRPLELTVKKVLQEHINEL